MLSLAQEGLARRVVDCCPLGSPIPEDPLCRNITILRGLEPPATETEIRAAAIQYVRKVSGVTRTSAATADAFESAVAAVAAATAALLSELPERRNAPATLPPLRRVDGPAAEGERGRWTGSRASGTDALPLDTQPGRTG